MSEPKDINKDFSLEKRIPQIPLPSALPDRLNFWLRLIVWITPGPVIVPVVYVIDLLGITNYLWFIILPLMLIISLGCGYCDAFLSKSIIKENGRPIIRDAIVHLIFFTICQIVIGPLTMLFLGYAILYQVLP